MFIEALSDIYKKFWLYLASLRHLLDWPMYFDLIFNPYGNPMELKSFHRSKY